MWNLWIRPPKRGGNDCLRYAISWLNKKCYKDITNYFSYNMNLMNQKNYCQAITKIHGILKLWRMRNFFIEGKIVVFTTIAISKLVYLVLLTVAPDHIIDEKVARIQKWFIPHNWLSIKKKRILMTMDIKKAFDSLDLTFVISVLKKLVLVII